MPILSPDYYSAPLSVIFELTHKCNLKCGHCLVSAGHGLENELSLNEIKGIIDQLHEMKVFSINFGGGEPLLRDDFVDIVKYASDLNFGIIISTNGYLVNPGLLDQLEELKTFTVQVSVDGLEETHDKFRGVKGSFKRAVDALKLFSEKGYNATMSTMILRENRHEFRELCELAIDMGLAGIKLSSFMPAGRGRDNKSFHRLQGEELQVFASEIAEFKKEFRELLFIDDKPTYSFLLKDNGKAESTESKNVKISCSAGHSSLVISPQGMVFACPFITDIPAGDLKNQNLKDIWKESEILQVFRNMNSTQLNGKCSTCKHLPAECQGGCRAAALLSSDDFYGEDPFCWSGCND
jgi:radical SAM protein with 4Fe4S-binding SPASM domain